MMIMLLWVGPYPTTGAFYVKFMRYMQPIVPPLLVLGALALWQSAPVRYAQGIAGAILVPTAIYALAFVHLYSEPHPWNSASGMDSPEHPNRLTHPQRTVGRLSASDDGN
ncbi:MAG: hypothetical protein R3C44_19945 [Chloroflexota bacterium]